MRPRAPSIIARQAVGELMSSFAPISSSVGTRALQPSRTETRQSG